jgi:glycosyltransferase involved in cell wall biosynthesis
MRAIVLSNIPHYHHLAEALYAAGFLDRYITAPALLEGESAPAWLPGKLRRKLEGRRLQGVPKSAVSQVRWPEILQRLLPLAGVISRERADWLNNQLFDRRSLRLIADCDVFHFVSSVGLKCAQKAKSAGATVVCDVRQEHPAFQRRILQEESALFGMKPKITGLTYESRVLDEFALADYIVTPSVHAKRTFLEEGFEPEKLLLLPYGVDVQHFRNEGKRDNVFRVIYAGSLTIRKGPQYLLEAFAQMRPANAELVLVGPLDPAFQPVLSRFEGSFRYAGVVPKIALKELYSSSSVFVLPSLADSYSLATLEAMACALPVIVSENTGAADAVEHGKEGFVVPIRNAGAIREYLELLQRNEDLRREMGARAAVRAREMSWARYGGEAVRYYQAMERKRSRQIDTILT